jgi:phospholipase/carboxylesterase
VVLLHGYGADGNDLIELAPHWADALPDAAFVSPHAPEPCEMSAMGRQWFGLVDRSAAAMRAGVVAAAPILDAYLDAALAARGLDESALALVGFSQGTMMALHVAARRQRPCAAVIGYSGRLVAPERLAKETIARPPVLLIHGDADPMVPFESLGLAAAALRGAGFTVETHASPGLGHGIDPAGLALGKAFLARALRQDLT